LQEIFPKWRRYPKWRFKNSNSSFVPSAHCLKNDVEIRFTTNLKMVDTFCFSKFVIDHMYF
jgi:hypothetical protein